MRRLSTVAILAMAATVLLPPPARAEETVTIRGGGWGHGIGMSQYGAYGRALNGKSSKQILKHYYTGVDVAPTKTGPIRVGLLPAYGASGTTSMSFSSKPFGGGSGTIKVKVKGEPTKIVAGGPTDLFTVETSGTGGFRVFRNGEQIKRDGKGIFGSLDEPLLLKYSNFGSALDPAAKSHDYPYGKAFLETYQSTSCANGMCMRMVLKLPMQKYLYGLGEVPSSWPAAALEAQAIAGRTYAFEKIQRDGLRHPCGCDVYDSTIDQAYIGDSKRTGSGVYWADWKDAVKATDGEVILYEGKPIQALYSSSSGGHTENNENVWGGTPLPYLRGVPDGPDKARGANPNHSWEVTMSWSAFSDKLDAAYGTGDLQDFEVLEPLGVSGRVTVVKTEGGGARITGTGGVARVSGWSLRSALGLKDSLFTVDVGFGVGKKFRSRYEALDGAPGDPTSKTYPVPKGANRVTGYAQSFSKGRMVKDRSTKKVTWQYGRILKRYNVMGRESSKLGMPATGIKSPGPYLFARYDNGRIVRSAGNGAHPILGGFDKAYVRVGKVDGPLGPPTTYRRKSASLPNGGKMQSFVGGALYKVRRKGPVFALWGKVAQRYAELGRAEGACGYPTADANPDGDSLKAEFENGMIHWSPASGVEVDCGQP